MMNKDKNFRLKRDIFFLILIVFSFISLVFASTFIDNQESDFNSGTYTNTTYNASGFIQLTEGNTSGIFTSQIFNAGSQAEWKNISWTQGGYYGQELPGNQEVETGLGGANMTGNVLLMNLNEESGTIVDSSGNGNNGTYNGALYSQDGKLNTALGFDGSNDYVDIGVIGGLSVSDKLTVTVWINISSESDIKYIISSLDSNIGYWLAYRDDGRGLTWALDNDVPGWSAVSTNHILDFNIWHAVTFVYDGSTAKTYVNGNEVHSLDASGDIDLSNSVFQIGARDGTSPWHGTIDEVAIFNRSLSEQEIQDIYKRGALRLNLSVQSCDDASCEGESWNNLGNNLTSPQNLSLDNNTYFQYKYEFETDNASYTPQLYNVTINYDLLDVTPPSITLNNPENNTNTSSQTLNLNFTATDDYPQNMECSIYLDDVLNQTNSSVLNNTLTNFEISEISEGSHTWKIECEDGASNSNTSETRNFYIDISPPSVSNIIYSPNASDDIDPSTEITINATITDSRVSVDTVILQYFNGSDWTNLTMTNNSATNYNATFTTQSTETNYTFNIWSNDTLGNSGTSSNTTFQSLWDCTWTATSDLGSTAGWDENKFIGNITINNTGDAEHSSGCSLTFHLTHDLTSGRIYFNNWASNQYLNYYDTSSLNPGSLTNITINATFLEVKEEPVNITILELTSNSETPTKYTTATILSNQAGPYLSQTLTTSSATYYLTPQNISLSGYIRNLMGSTTVNETNTAYNISFYWTLPSGLTNSSGDSSITFTNISNNSLIYNNIQAAFSDLASASADTYTISLHSKGYNLTGDLIENANQDTILTNSLNLTFLCYSVSDGIYVTFCGELDGDYVEPTASASTSTGGGGGGSSSQTKQISTSEDFQLVRGKENQVKIPIKNSDTNKSLSNLQIEVSGKIAKYIEVKPKIIAHMDPNSETEIILTITSPTYIDLGTQKITLTITGKLGITDYKETKQITLEIHELSGQEAKTLLTESIELLTQLKQANLSNQELENLLNQSQEQIKTFNYEIVRDNNKIIKQQVTSALKTKQIINELTSLLKTAEEKGIKITDSSRLIKLASLSLERGEFLQAYERAKDAQTTYAIEVSGKFGKITYYLKKYPAQISLSAIFLFIFSLGSYKLTRLRIIKRKIKTLKEEENIISELIATIQEQTFKQNKMSMEEYQTALEEYQKRLSKIIETLIELETQRIHALKFTRKNKKIKEERERIVQLIKSLQEDYLKKGSVETQTYNLKLESYNRRLTEIDESLATLEANKAFKGMNLFKYLKIPKEKRL